MSVAEFFVSSVRILKKMCITNFCPFWHHFSDAPGQHDSRWPPLQTNNFCHFDRNYGKLKFNLVAESHL